MVGSRGISPLQGFRIPRMPGIVGINVAPAGALLVMVAVFQGLKPLATRFRPSGPERDRGARHALTAEREEY